MGFYCYWYIVEYCKNYLFSFGVDGFSDIDVKKINLVMIKLFDMDKLKCVINYFYDMCIIIGCNVFKVEEICNVV